MVIIFLFLFHYLLPNKQVTFAWFRVYNITGIRKWFELRSNILWLKKIIWVTQVLRGRDYCHLTIPGLHTKWLWYESWWVEEHAQIICNSDESFTEETKHLKTVFIKNYSTDFIKCNTYIRPNNNCRNSYITTATIPLYIWKTSENHRLSTHTTTLQHLSRAQTHVQRLLANVEDKDKPEDRPGAVYKSLNRSNALWLPGNLYQCNPQKLITTQLNEHKRATKKGDLNSNIRTPLKNKPHHWLGLCYKLFNLQYRLLSINHTYSKADLLT